MAFASIHVPDFLVQSIVRGEAWAGAHGEPELRHRAIALVDGNPPLEKVVAASEAAMNAGIQLHMAKSQAAQFRGVEIRNRSREQERAAHATLLDLGWSFSPRVEDTAPDTIVLDPAVLASLFGTEENVTNQLARRAVGFRLLVNVAASSSIEAAILAARGFPGISLIPAGEEALRLARLRGIGGVASFAAFGTSRPGRNTPARIGARREFALARARRAIRLL